jgi:hypothetical protein
MTDLDRQAKSSDTTTMKHASMHKAKNRAPRLMKMQEQQTARQEIGMANQFFSCIVHYSPACSCFAFRTSVVLLRDASLSKRRKSKRAAETGLVHFTAISGGLTWRFLSQIISDGVVNSVILFSFEPCL